ncbi:16S rRNA (cytosine(1402)-N(4))-methyltransferase RsmH [bacterium]|nr:MAG: 16S rRNA (cytosine(1402)-N(4))-methyltransferase RsmH [bacterium]
MSRFATEYHAPVLLSPTVSHLVTKSSGVYVDGTLGGGGHSQAILEQLDENGKLFGIDQDDEALREATARLRNDARFEAVKGNFGFYDVLLAPEYKGKITGILLDLGVSSHQIDDPARGFSFQQEGPLDMRMGNLMRLSAEQVVNEYDLGELRRIFYEYGEERHSNAIAKKIIESRPIATTAELKKAITKVVSGKFENKTLARIFQAIRIEVNRELEMLRQALEHAVEWLEPGGRLVVISYHSLEDRLVKHFMKAGNFEGEIPKDLYGNNLSPFDVITRKPIEADDKEIAENPRSRSARLRVAEKREVQEAA